jgi:hypothetical protein
MFFLLRFLEPSLLTDTIEWMPTASERNRSGVRSFRFLLPITTADSRWTCKNNHLWFGGGECVYLKLRVAQECCAEEPRRKQASGKVWPLLFWLIGFWVGKCWFFGVFFEWFLLVWLGCVNFMVRLVWMIAKFEKLMCDFWCYRSGCCYGVLHSVFGM